MAPPGLAKMGKRLSVAFQGFHPSSFLSEETARLRELAQDKKVISAVSGGVDSTVATLVAREALGDRLFPVMLDTGFLRVGEPERVKERLGMSPTSLKVRLVHASGRFLASVRGKGTAEEKREKFRETFYQVLKEEAEREGCEYILQGTIAPDWIETQGGIKTQHNILEQVGIDPASTYGFKIIEPLSDLYKDQVRMLGRHLNLPSELSERQPFPGPGLLVRCIGNVTKEKIRVLKEATKMVETSLAPFNYEQYFAAVIENKFAKGHSLETVSETASEALGLPKSEVHADVFEDRVTGVKGDQRCYGLLAGVKLSEESRETYGWLQDRLRQLQAGIVEKFPDITRVAMLVKERRGGGPLSILVRAVSTRDFMTAAVSPVPWKILKDIGQQVLKEETVSRVYYDITPKPPGTIEFE
ncbi:GMP synthase [Candidatus Bathyarchaeota archaeon]|nr:MAG: GMP synthase [Candidatus Bathyarchaeota archaeon]